jgi:beta-lactamase class A
MAHTRRAMLMGTLSTLLGGCLAGRTDENTVAKALAEIESHIGGRLGVHVLHTGSKLRAGLHDDEPFAMCSTFRLLLAGAVLAQVDAGSLRPDRRIPFGIGDMVP